MLFRSINSHFNSAPAEVKNWIQNIKHKFSVNDIEGYLNKIETLKVAVIGETIIDQYTKVEPLSKSSKDPILAFHLQETEVYAGGILAIANNCSAWTKHVTAISVIGNNDSRPTDLARILNKDIELKLIVSSRPTITKHRFIDIGTNSKLFETYDFDPNSLPDEDIEKVLKEIILYNNKIIGHALW